LSNDHQIHSKVCSRERNELKRIETERIMGLTLHYEWTAKLDPAAARCEVERFHSVAAKLPFDRISEIYELRPPCGQFVFTPCENEYCPGDLFLSRLREDGEDELVQVPAIHSMFFYGYVQGAESAAIGLASHPPVVVHREDVITRTEGEGCEIRRGAGDPIEFPTERRGYYSWQSFCKTQYAANPKLGGEANFLRAHLSLIELIDQIETQGFEVQVHDDSEYAEHRDVDRLLATLREWDAIVANFAGKLSDALGDTAGTLIAPIKDRPDFEHLEAKGIKVLKEIASRQSRRKRQQKPADG
jgi:hypothetical protein